MKTSPCLHATRVIFLGALTGCGRLSFDGQPIDDAGGGEVTTRYRDEVLADAPWTYVRLGETTIGAGVADATGAGNGMRFRFYGAGAVTPVPGALAGDPDGALRFVGEGNEGDGSEAGLRFEVVPSIFTTAFSIEYLVKPNALPISYNHMAFFCEEHLVNGFRTGITRDLEVHAWNDEANGSGSIEAGVVPLGTWSHVVITKQSEDVRIYVDGVDVGNTTVGDYQPPGAAGECGLGALHGLPANDDFDELALYTTALSPARVAAHAAAVR